MGTQHSGMWFTKFWCTTIPCLNFPDYFKRSSQNVHEGLKLSKSVKTKVLIQHVVKDTKSQAPIFQGFCKEL